MNLKLLYSSNQNFKKLIFRPSKKNKIVKKLTLLLVGIFGVFNILNAQNWTQIGSDIDGEAKDDLSASSVSISADGKRVAIGAPYNNGNGADSGHVRVYAENGGTWTQLGSDIDGEAAGDFSGFSVSMSADGKRVAIGAPYNNNGNGTGSGHVRVYAENGGTWTQLGSDIDGEALGDSSGYSVSISADGKRVAIGAVLNDGNGIRSGLVRVYAESGGTWTQLGSDIDGEAAEDVSGISVSMSRDGKRVAIGAVGNDGNGADSGHVRVYAESGGTWTQLGSDIDGKTAGNASGQSVSMSADGKRVAIGASAKDSGHVRVYAESGGTWTQLGSDIDGEAASDLSGYSVSMSADGKRVAIGASGNDGNGADSGHVRVYAENGGTWTKVGSNDIDGEAAGDNSGYSVSMSADGMRVAIGAPFNDGLNSSLSNAGHVRVYLSPTALNTEDFEKETFSVWYDSVDCKLNIHSDFPLNDFKSYLVYNSMGQRVLNIDAPQSYTIDLGHIANGLYFLNITLKKQNKPMSIKFLKN